MHVATPIIIPSSTHLQGMPLQGCRVAAALREQRGRAQLAREQLVHQAAQAEDVHLLAVLVVLHHLPWRRNTCMIRPAASFTSKSGSMSVEA